MQGRMENNVKFVVLITDGGCRGNPGEGAIGFMILDESKCVLVKLSKCIGYTTSNRAEYLALIEGLDFASRYTSGTVHCFLDSELVVKQVKEEWKIKDDSLSHLFIQVLLKESLFQQVTFTHLKRTHPAIAAVDKLVNQALENGGK